MSSKSIGRGFKSLILLCMLFFYVISPVPSFGAAADQEKSVTLAVKLYDDMKSISIAVEAYRKKNGVTPSSMDELVAGAFLKGVPVMGEELDGGAYLIQKRYGDMDGQGAEDDTIYSGENIPEAVCLEFNKRYAHPPLNEGTIFDYTAAGRKYPGEVFGREMFVYAIKWESERNVCEINWLINYN